MNWNEESSGQARRGSWRGRSVRGNYRGGFRGGSRGGSSRGGHWHDKNASCRKKSDISEQQEPKMPCGPLIERLRAAELDREAAALESAAVITDVKTVTSFSWVDAKTPTIMIPGEPPRWTPPTSYPPPSLSQDAGVYFRDVNAASYPAHPMEPTVVASLAADPSLPGSANIVACGSTMGNLLRFLSGDDKPFRMLAEIVKGTLFLVRRERSPTEHIANIYGYGHSFPEAYTTWNAAVRGSTSHHRVIRYSFGHLDIVMRYEVDGYLEEEKEERQGKEEVTEGKDKQAGTETPSVEDLIADLGGLNTAKSVTATATESSSGGKTSSPVVTVRHGGNLVERGRLFDLKTRSERKRDIEDTVTLELPRLWVRQTDNFILAYHARGTFNDVKVLPVRDRVRAWESSPQQRPTLRRLAALLHRLIVATRTAPDQRLEVVYAGGGDGGDVGAPGAMAAAGSQSSSRRGSSQGLPDEAPYLELRAQLPGTESALSSSVGEQWEHELMLASGPKSDSDSTASSGRNSAFEEEEHIKVKSVTEDEKRHEKATEGDLPSLAELIAWDKGSEDYTGCSAACGYCGECTY